MVDILLIIVGAISLIFLQSVLNTIGGFSLLLVAAVFAYQRIRLVVFLGLILPAALINDVYFSYPIGFTFLLLVVASLLFKFVSRMLPTGNPFIEIATLIFTFIGFHILFIIGAGVIEHGGIVFGWAELLNAIKYSLIETAIYFALKTILNKINAGRHTTIKL